MTRGFDGYEYGEHYVMSGFGGKYMVFEKSSTTAIGGEFNTLDEAREYAKKQDERLED